MPAPETVRYTCPHCHSTIKGPASAAGKSAPCPRCKKPLTLTASPPAASNAVVTQSERPVDPPPRAPVFVPADRDSKRPVVRRPIQDGGEDDQPTRRLAVEHRARGGFGTGLKVTLGILTAVGVVVAGLLLAFCVLPMAGVAGVGGRAANAVAEAAEKQRRADAAAMSVTDAKTGEPIATPPTAATAPDKPAEPARATGLGQGAVIDGLQVQVMQVYTGKARLTHRREATRSQDSLLTVRVRLTTADDTRKYDYRTWHGSSLLAKTSCVDNFGNRYKEIDFGFGTQPEGRTDSGSLTAGQVVMDDLVYELTIPKAEYIDLDLPGDNAGVKGTFRFRVYTREFTPSP